MDVNEYVKEKRALSRDLAECQRDRGKALEKNYQLRRALRAIVGAIEREDSPAFRDCRYQDEDLALLTQAHQALEPD